MRARTGASRCTRRLWLKHGEARWFTLRQLAGVHGCHASVTRTGHTAMSRTALTGGLRSKSPKYASVRRGFVRPGAHTSFQLSPCCRMRGTTSVRFRADASAGARVSWLIGFDAQAEPAAAVRYLRCYFATEPNYVVK